jgi:hypothetical protein
MHAGHPGRPALGKTLLDARREVVPGSDIGGCPSEESVQLIVKLVERVGVLA